MENYEWVIDRNLLEDIETIENVRAFLYLKFWHQFAEEALNALNYPYDDAAEVQRN